LDETKAAALLEGVVEVLGDSEKVFRHPKVLLFACSIGATTLFGKIARRYTSWK
jgi:hypothetical protein